MKELVEYLKTQILNEHLLDTKVQLIIVCGPPASGKTSWVNNNIRELFPTLGKNTASILDTDNKLHQVQDENCKRVASLFFDKCIYAYCLTMDNNDPTRDSYSQKGMFEYAYSQIKKELDEETLSKNYRTPLTELSVTYNWIKPYMDRYVHEVPEILVDNTKARKEFEKDFRREFFKKDFMSDFSKRYISDQYHVKSIDSKIKSMGISMGKDYGIGQYMGNDIVMTITGDKIEKIINTITKSQEANLYVVSVVFLDMPEEECIKNDNKRKEHTGRGVGQDLIRMKIEGINKTWAIMKQEYREMGIWKLIKIPYTIPKGNSNWGKYDSKRAEIYYNYGLQKDQLNLK